MKIKTLIIMICLLCCLSCKTTSKSDASTKASKIDTSVSQQDTRTGSEDVSIATKGKSETDTQKSETENSFKIKFFTPDSTGKQYLKEISGTEKQVVSYTKLRAEWELSVKSKLKYLHEKVDNLEQRIDEKSEEKTVSKTGFTFLEKTGLTAIVLLVLVVIFWVIKWRLNR